MTPVRPPAEAEGPLSPRCAAFGLMRTPAAAAAPPWQAACGIGDTPDAGRRRGLRPTRARRPAPRPHALLPRARGHFGIQRMHYAAFPPDHLPRPAGPPAASPPRASFGPQGAVQGAADAASPDRPIGRAAKSTAGPSGAGPRRRPPDTKDAPGGAATPCPFCGGLGLPKKPVIDRLSGSSVSVGVASLHLVVDSSGEEYYKCHGCDMSFVFADREVETMLPGMMVDLSVAIRIKHYYGDGVSARDLLTRHRTATVRKVRGRLSFFSSRTARNELIVCFNCNGIRTFGSFRRRRGANGYYYTFEGLDRP